MAVVKANAYGHGLIKTVNALADYADAFAVSRISEAVSIRKIGVSKPVLLLGGILDDKEAGQVAELGLWTAVHNQAQIRLLDGISKAAKLTFFLKVDADMNRLGFPLAEVAAATAALKSNPAIAEIVLMTHFANADVADGLSAPMAKIAPLHKLYNRVSLANSAAALLHGDINDDWGRIGIALYGSSPAPAWQNNKALGLRAVMTLTAPLLTVRQVKSGECVGYGSEWMADKPTKVGIASVGYANGYPRLPKGAYATLNGTPAPVIGRVSMEMTALDLSANPDAKAQDTAIMWGDSRQLMKSPPPPALSPMTCLPKHNALGKAPCGE